MAVRIGPAIAILLLTLVACSEPGGADAGARTPAPSATAPTTAGTPTTSPSTPGIRPLTDSALLEPGRYRLALPSTCDPKGGCPKRDEPPLPALELTVPQGWSSNLDVMSLFPAAGWDDVSRNSPALALGWSNFWAGVYSEPCHEGNPPPPTDVRIGPTVDDLVDAITSHPEADVTEPVPVTLGRYRGRFFTLHGPKDISGCGQWRLWDPAPYMQGDENIWDVWVVDVDGARVVIEAEYFPETPAQIRADLRAMAESIRFTPAEA